MPLTEEEKAELLALMEERSAATPATQETEAPSSWADVPGMAIRNLPASAAQMAGDVWSAVTSPVETAKAVGNVGVGALQKAAMATGLRGLPPEDDKRKYADMVADLISSRYGDMAAVRNTLATDPVGVLGDVSTLLAGGGALAAKMPGAVGRAGRAVRAGGAAIEPFGLAAGGMAKGGGKALSGVAGMMTGTGAEAVRSAYGLGKEGGERAKAFRAGLREQSDPSVMVSEGKTAVRKIRDARNAAYNAAMEPLKADKKILDMGPIYDAGTKVEEAMLYEGAIVDPSGLKVVQDMAEAVADWSGRDPAKFRTVYGFDRLKRRLGKMRDATEANTPERMAADQVYQAVKDAIVQQSPKYGDIMANYGRESAKAKEIERVFGLGEKAMEDTAIRRMQSLGRNNVATNYGNRLRLAQEMEAAGATGLLPSAYGQQMSSITPRGLAGAVGAGGTLGAIQGSVNPLALALMSPRLVGETTHALGRMDRKTALLRALLGAEPRMAAFQAGRMQDFEERQ